MRRIDIAVQVDRLRALADRFDALRTQLLKDKPLTGTGGLRQLGKRITDSHELVAEALTRLTLLDDSQATRITGALAALDCASSVVAGAAQASASLALAVCDNAYDAASWEPTRNGTTTAVRDHRHREARTNVAAHIDDAIKDLHLRHRMPLRRHPSGRRSTRPGPRDAPERAAGQPHPQHARPLELPL